MRGHRGIENEPQLADADQRLGPLVAWKSKFCCWIELNKHAHFLPSPHLAVRNYQGWLEGQAPKQFHCTPPPYPPHHPPLSPPSQLRENVRFLFHAVEKYHTWLKAGRIFQHPLAEVLLLSSAPLSGTNKAQPTRTALAWQQSGMHKSPLHIKWKLFPMSDNTEDSLWMPGELTL